MESNIPKHQIYMAGQYRYELVIVQQPIRARMCGLGDKDRRQISPPPFIKLNVYDKETNQLLDVDEVDITTFLLLVELWSTDEKEDLNLDQNIISEEHSSPKENDVLIDESSGKALDGKVMIAPEGPSSSSPQSIIRAQRNSSGSESEGSLGEIPTRNLIGNLVTNAFKLFDDKNTRGIWFILHDLSVRIEGEFKLRFSFVDLNTDEMVYKFSDAFKVYSAKKFPGVVDSSQLGRAFASQGVKIPIRRDTKDH